MRWASVLGSLLLVSKTVKAFVTAPAAAGLSRGRSDTPGRCKDGCQGLGSWKASDVGKRPGRLYELVGRAMLEPLRVGNGDEGFLIGREEADSAAESRDRGGEVEAQLETAMTGGARTTIPTDVAIVGAPQQTLPGKEYSIEAILKELAEIQNQGPKNVCVLGTRHCSFLHQQIIELLAYALVLSGNHVFTSGAMGTNAATIRGALRAEREDLLTVVLPQSLSKQSPQSAKLIKKVQNVVENPQNDDLPLDVASRLCNSDLLSRSDQLICFAFHDSNTIIQTTEEARANDMIVTELYLD
ncbi:unnamed protein product [Discosporangium mesarthrocarpum]